MRIFLAGATGVIGRRLAPLLVDRGHSVTGFVRRDADAGWLRSLGAEAVRGDVFDADGVRRAVALAAPDVVMHQLTDLKGGNFRANSEMRITGTRNLVDAALAAGVRRMVAQSIAWAYQAGEVPAAEDVPLDLGSEGNRLRSVQGVAALEGAVREAPEWVVLRYGLLYGPGTWYSRGGLRADQAARGKLAADGDVSSFVHVDDAAGAAADALSWPTGFVNVCDDVPAAGREWVPAFCRAVGVAPVPALPVDEERHGWARGADNGYARKELNWTPAWPSWRDGFAALQTSLWYLRVNRYFLLDLTRRQVLIVAGLVSVNDTAACLTEGHVRAGDGAHRGTLRIDSEGDRVSRRGLGRHFIWCSDKYIAWGLGSEGDSLALFHGDYLLGLGCGQVPVVAGLVSVNDTRTRLIEGHRRAGDGAHRGTLGVDSERDRITRPAAPRGHDIGGAHDRAGRPGREHNRLSRLGTAASHRDYLLSLGRGKISVVAGRLASMSQVPG